MFGSLLVVITSAMFGVAQLSSTVAFTRIIVSTTLPQAQQTITPPPFMTTYQIPYKLTYTRSHTLLAVSQDKTALNGETDDTPSSKLMQDSLSTDNINPTIASIDKTNVSSKPFVKKKLQTYLRYLEVECWKRSDLRGLETVLQAVASACKQITRIVQRAQTDDVYGVALDVHGNPLGDTNIQGEVQQKLDVLCNTIMLQAFCGSGRDIHAVASEEEDEPRCCSDVMVRQHLDDKM
jgi:hypothetical protein